MGISKEVESNVILLTFIIQCRLSATSWISRLIKGRTAILLHALIKKVSFLQNLAKGLIL